MAILESPAGKAIFSALFDRYGPALTFPEVAAVLKYKSARVAYNALGRSRFPCRIIDLGGRYGVSIADLTIFLVTGEHQDATPYEPMAKRPGRPTKKSKQLQAKVGGNNG